MVSQTSWKRVEPFNVETSEAALRAFADEAGVKAGLLINGARTMLTGQGCWTIDV